MNAIEKLKLTKELRTLKSDMDTMSAIQKLKATKRVREIAVLLGGNQIGGGMTKSVGRLVAETNEVVQDNSQPNTDIEDWQSEFKDSAQTFGENLDGYLGASTDEEDPIISTIAKQPFGSWAFIKRSEDGFINVFYSLGEGKYGGGDGSQTLKEAYDNAIASRDKQASTDPILNPLYQSVIDGTKVTTALIEQVLEQAKTEADPASNAQLIEAVEIIRKKVIELAGA